MHGSCFCYVYNPAKQASRKSDAKFTQESTLFSVFNRYICPLGISQVVCINLDLKMCVGRFVAKYTSTCYLGEEIKFYISSTQTNFLAEPSGASWLQGRIVSAVREHLILFSPGLQNTTTTNHLQKATVFQVLGLACLLQPSQPCCETDIIRRDLNIFFKDVKILAQVSEVVRSKFRIQTQVFLIPLHTPFPPRSASQVILNVPSGQGPLLLNHSVVLRIGLPWAACSSRYEHMVGAREAG